MERSEPDDLFGNLQGTAGRGQIEVVDGFGIAARRVRCEYHGRRKT